MMRAYRGCKRAVLVMSALRRTPTALTFNIVVYPVFTVLCDSYGSLYQTLDIRYILRIT